MHNDRSLIILTFVFVIVVVAAALLLVSLVEAAPAERIEPKGDYASYSLPRTEWFAVRGKECNVSGDCWLIGCDDLWCTEKWLSVSINVYQNVQVGEYCRFDVYYGRQYHDSECKF